MLELVDIPDDERIRVQYNTVPRSDLLAGDYPKWRDLDEKSIKRYGLPGMYVCMYVCLMCTRVCMNARMFIRV